VGDICVQGVECENEAAFPLSTPTKLVCRSTSSSRIVSVVQWSLGVLQRGAVHACSRGVEHAVVLQGRGEPPVYACCRSAC
jgi:hypothetical protein